MWICACWHNLGMGFRWGTAVARVTALLLFNHRKQSQKFGVTVMGSKETIAHVARCGLFPEWDF